MSLAHLRLGKRATRRDRRTLRLANYLTTNLVPPASVNWGCKVKDWGMLANDRLGCCTIAAVAHAVQTWTANSGLQLFIEDDTVVKYYAEWDGYIPGDAGTDQGGVELDVLKDFQQQGFDNIPLTAFAAVNPLNVSHVKNTIALYGGIYVGVELPLTAQNQDNLWELSPNADPNDSAPGSWGGHAIWLPAYDGDNSLSCVTWGKTQKMTWEWFTKYCSEAYALLSPAWIGKDAVLDLKALQEDLIMVQL